MSATTQIFQVWTDSGRTIHVVKGSAADSVEREAGKIQSRALRAGHLVVLGDGTRIARRRIADFNPDAIGSEQYTWHNDGNRVRGALFEVYTSPDGTVTRKRLRAIWMDPDA